MSITALAVVEKEIRGSEVMTRISNSLGKPATDPSVMKFINGAIMYMQSKVGQKGDVSHCSKQSIVDSLINAATVKLPVDSKHYACLIAYGSTCTFQPEWRGYVAKIKEADTSAEITPVLVFKGDKFAYSRKDGNVTFEHIVFNPFEDSPDNIIGAYCYIKTDRWSDIEVMSKKELDEVRASSKAGYAYIWNAWPLEQYRKTIIRRGCKRKFTAAVAELDALDNKLYVEKVGPEVPKITETSPLPSVQEAEVVHENTEDKAPDLTKEELEAKAAEVKARIQAQEAEEKAKNPPVEHKEPESGIPANPAQKMLKGLLAAYYPPKNGGPHSWYIQGEYAKSFDDEVANTLNDHRAKEEEVELICNIVTKGKFVNNMIQEIVVGK